MMQTPLLRLSEDDIQRHVAVPWVAAALGERWKDSEAYGMAGFEDTIQRLEDGLKQHASPAVKRLKRYAALGALGDTPQDRGRSIRRLYLDGAAETAARRQAEDAEKAARDKTAADEKAAREAEKAGRKKEENSTPAYLVALAQIYSETD